MLLIAFGCYIYLYPEHRVKKSQLILMFLCGLAYIIAVFSFDAELFLFGYWKTTAMPVAFYIFPIVIMLFRKFYHIKIPGVIGELLTQIGKASYHIFLTQMVYYHFELGGKIMSAEWYLAVPFNLIVTLMVGLLFFEFDKRFLKKVKKVKQKLRQAIA